MWPPAPPKVSDVEVVAAQPADADSAAMVHLSAETSRSLDQVPYTVKVQLETKPPVTSMAWALYVDNVRIPKYWEYEDGIYFEVLGEQFFSDHEGKPLRFSQDGIEFFDTGVKLPTAPATPSEFKAEAARPSKRKAVGTAKSKKTRASKSKASKSSKRKAR